MIKLTLLIFVVLLASFGLHVFFIGVEGPISEPSDWEVATPPFDYHLQDKPPPPLSVSERASVRSAEGLWESEGGVSGASVPIPAITDFGAFVDPAEPSTWRKMGGTPANYGDFVDPEDSSTWFKPSGPADYGQFVDPLTASGTLRLENKQRDFGRLVDPEDPYTWRQGSEVPVEYGNEYLNPSP